MPHWNMGRYAKKEKQGFKWHSDTGSSRITFVKGLGVVVIILLIAGFFYNSQIRNVLGDYNTSFGHTRSVIYAEQSTFDSSRWNYNSTCVTFSGSNVLFTYGTGSSGTGGNNCASADQIIQKAPISLATVIGKQLEIDFAWYLQVTCSACYQRALVILRTNATLPSFKENYSPFDDPENRLIFDLCPSVNSALCGVNGATGPYIQHEPGKAINREGPANDLAFSTSLPGSSLGITMQVQAVFNFTASNNFLAYATQSSGSSSPSNNLANYLPSGLDYYIMFKGMYNTNVSPTASQGWILQNGAGTNPITLSPVPFGIWSVPSACEDPLNKVVCSVAPPAGYSAPSTSNLSLFNPVSWIVYLGKVVIWAIQQALALVAGGLAYFFSLINANAIGPILQNLWSLIAGFFWGLIITTMNTVGGLFGAATIGTQFSSFINNSASFIGAMITNVLAMGGNLTTLLTNLITWTFGANGFFMMIFNGVNTWLTLFFNLLGSIQKILGFIFKGGSIGLQFLFLFDMLWLIIVVHDDGMRGISEEWWPVHNLVIIGLAKLVFFITSLFGQYVYWVVSMIELAIEDVKPSVAVAG